jgi:hypothetical protein
MCHGPNLDNSNIRRLLCVSTSTSSRGTTTRSRRHPYLHASISDFFSRQLIWPKKVWPLKHAISANPIRHRSSGGGALGAALGQPPSPRGGVRAISQGLAWLRRSARSLCEKSRQGSPRCTMLHGQHLMQEAKRHPWRRRLRSKGLVRRVANERIEIDMALSGKCMKYLWTRGWVPRLRA